MSQKWIAFAACARSGVHRGVGRAERKERCTRDIAGFRLSSITRLDVSLPCYGCSFRKFASPLGLSRPGNSHLGAMVMRPSRYRAPFNPYFRRRIIAVSTVLGPFVFEHRRDLSHITSTRILRCLFFVRRGERIAFDGDAASNEDCVQKWTRRDTTFFADGVDRSSLFTWMFAIFVSECTFPLKWEGTWFQSGVRQPIVISRNELSSKGRCLHNEGDKFLLVDQWVHTLFFFVCTL